MTPATLPRESAFFFGSSNDRGVTAWLSPSFAEADELLENAVMYSIQVIGEAATKVSDTFKTSHPEIPWSAIVGMRHRLVHDYTRIDVATVWRVVQTHLPTLIALLEPLVPPQPSHRLPLLRLVQ